MRANKASWCVVIALLMAWTCYFALEDAWVRLVPLDARYQATPIPRAEIVTVGREGMGIVTLLIVGLWLIYLFRNKLWKAGFAEGAFRVIMTLGCSWVIFLVLRLQAFEPSWYPLKPLIDNPRACPLIGHRILFVWLAQFAQLLRPSMDPVRLYMASQIVPILFTTYIVGRWSAIFVGSRLSFLGQVLLVVFLVPTFSYYNFYDIGIVGFFCAAFLLLYRRRYWAFVAVTGLATLNHENALLLIPVAVFACYREVPRRQLSLIALSGLGVHLAVRGALELFMPLHTVGDMGVWANPLDLVQMPVMMVMSIGLLLPRWALAFLGLPAAPPLVRRLACVYPLLLVVTAVFGQLHEARQFDAGIPVEIGVIMCYIRRAVQSAEAEAPLTEGVLVA